VERVEVPSGNLSSPDLIQRGTVFLAPGVGKRGPVDREILGFANSFPITYDAATPVYDGAEHVENEGIHFGGRH
jgi:hypothetical protein